MNKLNIPFSVVAISLILLTSCGKKDDVVLTVAQSDIVGTWEKVGGSDFTECTNGDNALIKISLTEIKEGPTDDDGCHQVSGFYAASSYEYKNGNSLVTSLGTYKITRFEDNKMTLEVSTPLLPGVTTNADYIKK